MNLTNQFLVATTALDHSSFERAVIYLCQHDHSGAMGLVINRITNARIAEIFNQLDIKFTPNSPHKKPIYAGGPVHPENGFILHSPVGEWESSHKVSKSLAITTSRDILTALANNEGPENWLITLGYAGWAPNQLEGELTHNHWLVAKPDQQLIFDVPADIRWDTALKSLGIKDASQLSHFSGHA